MVAELVIWNNDVSSLSHREKEKLAKFRGGTQSFRQWMLSIERQIGSEDPRLWMLIHRTVDFTVPIVQQVIEDYVTNMRDDTVYWQTQSDGTTKGEFAYRYTELSTLVMKLHYRLLDALEDEALACIETQQVARNGCEVLRLLKSRYALETVRGVSWSEVATVPKRKSHRGLDLNLSWNSEEDIWKGRKKSNGTKWKKETGEEKSTTTQRTSAHAWMG